LFITGISSHSHAIVTLLGLGSVGPGSSLGFICLFINGYLSLIMDVRMHSIYELFEPGYGAIVLVAGRRRLSHEIRAVSIFLIKNFTECRSHGLSFSFKGLRKLGKH